MDVVRGRDPSNSIKLHRGIWFSEVKRTSQDSRKTKPQYSCLHLTCRELLPCLKLSMCGQVTAAKHAKCFNFIAFHMF